MNAFDHMLTQLSSDAFYDATKRESVTRDEFQLFLKEFTFEKLKGKTLGECFAEKFQIKDRVLYMLKDDSNVMLHIKTCGYIK